MKAGREFQGQEGLEQIVEIADQTVRDQEVSVEQERSDAEELMEKLEEAEAAAAEQEQVEQEGRDAEEQIERVAGV